MKTTFSPILPDYYDLFTDEMTKDHSRIIYFDEEDSLEEAEGMIDGLSKNDLNEEFLSLDNGKQVRIDRIITINGKPGPAYGEYENFGIACHMCIGGKGEV